MERAFRGGPVDRMEAHPQFRVSKEELPATSYGALAMGCRFIR